jgi:hypothetical protein
MPGSVGDHQEEKECVMKKTTAMRPPKTTMIPTISSTIDEIEEARVCSCFPEHCCMLDEHGPCWCGGYLIQAEDNTIIYVHNQES